MCSSHMHSTYPNWKATYRSTTRELARYLVDSLYPQEVTVFDLVADAYLDLGMALPIGGATELKVAGLPFGAIEDLGSMTVLAFVAMTMAFIAEVGSMESLSPAEAYQRFVNRPDLQERCMRKAQLPPADGLGLDVRRAKDLMQRTLDFIGAPKFMLAKPTPFEETRHHEFKAYTAADVAKPLTHDAEKYVVGFLNSDGGSIYFGIEDKHWTVVGVHLRQSERDKLARDIASKLRRVRPTLDPTEYRLTFHPVYREDELVPELYVVEVSVPMELRSEVYFTGDNVAYARLTGVTQKLSEPEIQELRRRRASLSKAE